MAVGKNKRISKGKKGGKKKIIDPFTRKEWYDVKVPNNFNAKGCGWSLVTRTQGTKIASEGLKGRVLEVSLADLNKDEDQAYRKIKLRVEDVQKRSCLTNFYGMDFTTDKLKSLVRKWQTLIEAHTTVKTTDGFVLRLFCIGFTKRRPNQIKKTCYAQTAQIKQIRKKMNDIMVRESSTCDLKDLVNKFIPNAIGRQIESSCQGIYPLINVFIRKVKMVKTPKFDPFKFAELYGEGAAAPAAATSADTGAKVERVKQ